MTDVNRQMPMETIAKLPSPPLSFFASLRILYLG